MRGTLTGTTIGIALIAFVPAALTAGTWGWSHPWAFAFGTSGAILALGFIIGLILYLLGAFS